MAVSRCGRGGRRTPAGTPNRRVVRRSSRTRQSRPIWSPSRYARRSPSMPTPRTIAAGRSRAAGTGELLGNAALDLAAGTLLYWGSRGRPWPGSGHCGGQADGRARLHPRSAERTAAVGARRQSGPAAGWPRKPASPAPPSPRPYHRRPRRTPDRALLRPHPPAQPTVGQAADTPPSSARPTRQDQELPALVLADVRHTAKDHESGARGRVTRAGPA
jgi:hypothetical protein